MFRFIIFLLIVLGLASLFAWVTNNPGTVFLQWEWLATQLGRPGEEVGIPLVMAMTALVGIIFLVMLAFGVLKGIFGFPSVLGKFFENRRRDKGYKALSQGLIAASSGDAATARSKTKESSKLLGDDPLVALLGTQTALLDGNREEARGHYQKMLANDDTRLVALRGLFLEAERQGVPEAARHYAEEAVMDSPALPWAGNAKLRYQAADEDWDAAIQTLEANRSAGLIEKDTAKRHRAVLLTAKAMTVEQAEPESARKLAKEAHKLAKDLVPAATTYARAASRLGDIKGASKILEAAWKTMPHPELAQAYSVVRAGDSVQDRMKRAEKLASLRPNHAEGNIAVAIAAIDAKDWDKARSTLESVLTTKPTRKAHLLMAEIEEGQHGDQGRMRDWLSRAVRAPADEAWTADGHVSEEWMPMSPITGEIDAFEWKVPVEELQERKSEALTIEELREAAVPIAAPVAAVTAAATATVAADTDAAEKPVAEDAEIIEADSKSENVAEKTADQPSEDTAETEAKKVEAESETQKADIVTADAESDADAEKPDEAKSEDVKSDEAKSEDKAPEDNPAEEQASQPEESNVVSIETAAAARQEKSEVSAAPQEEAEVTNVAASADIPVGKAAQGNNTAGKRVNYALDRRPDDPGVHPDKEPPKKGFKLF